MIFVSESTSRARFTSAISPMARTFAPSATRRWLSRPSRNTPSSEPNVTPAILNASQRILSKAEKKCAMAPRTRPKATTLTRDTRR